MTRSSHGARARFSRDKPLSYASPVIVASSVATVRVGESKEAYSVSRAKRRSRDACSDLSNRHFGVAKILSSARAHRVDDSKHRLGVRHKVFVSRIRDALRRVHGHRER